MEVKVSKIMPGKRKLLEEPREAFVLKSEESTEVTKTVSVTIPDFTKKIDDLDNKKKLIKGPKFKVGEKEFSFLIFPEHLKGFIAVYLANNNFEPIETSFVLKHESGVAVCENREIVNFGGSRKFLSHADYKKWAEDHGDVFRVEVEITLHVEQGNPEPEWETIPRKRYVVLFFS